MDPGYEWLQKLDIIYNCICIDQLDKINARTKKLHEIEWDKSSSQWLCKTILNQCRTVRELCTYGEVCCNNDRNASADRNNSFKEIFRHIRISIMC